MQEKVSQDSGPVVWKFEVKPWVFTVDMPQGAEVLSAGVQGDRVYVWALCDPTAPVVPTALGAVQTGAALPRELGPEKFLRFVDTVRVPDTDGLTDHGGLFFHIWAGA